MLSFWDAPFLGSESRISAASKDCLHIGLTFECNLGKATSKKCQIYSNIINYSQSLRFLNHGESPMFCPCLCHASETTHLPEAEKTREVLPTLRRRQWLELGARMKSPRSKPRGKSPRTNDFTVETTGDSLEVAGPSFNL